MSLPALLKTPVRTCADACELAVSHGTPRRAAKLALVVGSLLVVINQWEAFNGAAKFDWVKVGLTYCVPYMVSTYTSVSKDLHHRKQAWALQE